MLFDAHLHFTDEQEPLNREKVTKIVLEAEKKGVQYFVSNSTSFKTIDETISLVKQYKQIYGGIGLFPTEFKREEDLKQIEAIMEKIAKLKQEGLLNRFLIGEVGLDFKDLPNSSLEKKKQEIQEKALKEEIEIAKENKMYLEIHSRFAVKQTVEVLKKSEYRKVIMHWFTDSKKYINRVAEEGYLITVGPKYLVDERIKENIRDVNPKQILFETDYPASCAGKIHEPSEIPLIFQKYCKDFEIEPKEMEKYQYNNFKKIFRQ